MEKEVQVKTRRKGKLRRERGKEGEEERGTWVKEG
jgi:hypothetical protein